MTGREVLEKVAGEEGKRIADAVERIGFVCVPVEPSKEMVDAAWASALAENAEGVWSSMIEACGGIKGA
jgi:hypothetical protein